MKVLSILIVLFVFQINAQSDGDHVPSQEVPSSVNESAYFPQIISNILTVGKSNKLLVAYDPMDTQASSPFDVLGAKSMENSL